MQVDITGLLLVLFKPFIHEIGGFHHEIRRISWIFIGLLAFIS